MARIISNPPPFNSIERRGQIYKPTDNILIQKEPDHTATSTKQSLPVTQRLSIFKYTECDRLNMRANLIGNIEILRIPGSELNEKTCTNDFNLDRLTSGTYKY
jgi:hypothetical protein